MSFAEYIMQNTVKFVYKDHPRDQQNMVLIHRWSLYAGSIAWKLYSCGLVKRSLYKQVVFRPGLTVGLSVMWAYSQLQPLVFPDDCDLW